MKKSQLKKENKFKNIFSSYLRAMRKETKKRIPVDEDTTALEHVRSEGDENAVRRALVCDCGTD